MERIDKLLANTGRWSRKEARDLVRAGRVTCSGVRVVKPEEKCALDDIAVDGQLLQLSTFQYLMMNKPAGLLSATEDKRQKTVLDLLPQHFQRIGLFPVGRLDKDTEGLLLLTNHGELAHQLLSPKSHVDKLYYAEVERPVTAEDCEAFAAGMVLPDGTKCLPAVLRPVDGKNAVWVTLREGKFHQVKRMLAQCGKPVTYLKRVEMGPLKLDEKLQPGQWRELTAQERSALVGEKEENT